MDRQQVQGIAKETIRRIAAEIQPGMSLKEIRTRCEEHMMELGADSFWYHGVGAFVFSGDETAVSVSGRHYQTPERILAANDILTIDLSPSCNGVWGDYARTLILQDGIVAKSVETIICEQFRNGLMMEEKLHKELFCFATPETTFEQLYEHMNALIAAEGFVNLDFNGNLGHSIERKMDERIYIEKGNQRPLRDAEFFTFEPHISTAGSCFGYKKENIYYFENGTLKEL